MFNILVKYWVEFFMTLLSTLFIYLINQYIGLRNGMKSLLKNEIIRTYETYVKHLKNLLYQYILIINICAIKMCHFVIKSLKMCLK